MATSSIPPPRHLQLEVTSACNLSCAMCLVRYRPAVGRAEGAMPLELFRRLVDGAPELEQLTLQGLGEPLLHPRIDEMVAYAKARGVRVGFNSNAMLLTRRRAERMVALGLDWLHVSLDGATAETFEGIRAGARLERVALNLAGLQEAKRAAGAALPWVRVVFVAMRRNLGELSATVRLVGELGVEELRVQGLAHDFSDTDPGGAYGGIRAFAEAEHLGALDPAEVEAAFADARREADRCGVDLRLPEPAAAAPRRRTGEPACRWPFEAAYVTSSGTVQPCCMVMGDDRVTMGSARHAELGEIWSGEAYAAFRDGLLGDEPPPVCAGCALYRGTF